MLRRGFLRPNVKIEPLLHRWYAWSLLVPPVSHALFMVRKQVPILESFLAEPEVHAEAVLDPAMVGGPFVDLPVERAGEVEALLDQMRARSARLFELERDVTALADLCAAADGSSLEPRYREVPASLRGLVELTYDGFQRGSFRLFERLLYRSALYDDTIQELALAPIIDDRRPFTLSTPTFARPGMVFARTPFASAATDDLVRSRLEAAEIGALGERLGVDDLASFAALFEERPMTTPPPRYDGPGVRLQYFGHACVLLETAGFCLMTDPALGFAYPGAPADGRFTLADVPARVDYVVITHNHQDHLLFEMLLMIRDRIGTILVPRAAGGSPHDPSLKLVLEQIGFHDVRELDVLEELAIPGGTVRPLPFLGEHGDLDIRAKVAWSVSALGKHVVFAADSNNLEPELFDRVHDLVGDVDVLFVGMECEGAPVTWGYGPVLMRPLSRAHEQSRRLNGCDAAGVIAVTERLRCKQVYVYAMGQEPWLSHVMGIHYGEDARPITESDALVAHCRARGIPSERLYISKKIAL